MNETRVGLAMCGSFCTFEKAFTAIEKLSNEYDDIVPIMSEISQTADTRFGKAVEHLERLESITGKNIIRTIAQAEPIGPKKLLDVLVIVPCTGNTLAKIANGITDSCVSMAAKAHLRNRRPLIIALTSNDALKGNAENLGRLLARENIYFVPMYQDDPVGKPASLTADLNLLSETIKEAIEGRQLQPVFVKNI